MQITIGKILSLAIAIVYSGVFVIWACVHSDLDSATMGAFVVLSLRVCIPIFIPVALIWFPEQIGAATGYFAGHCGYVDSPTPPILISIMGWFFLVGLPFFVLLMRYYTGWPG